jgi:UDP-glucose 4-epimerase
LNTEKGYEMGLKFSKALVTGGAGFIGSHLTQTLVREGCKVTVLDNLSSGHLENLNSVRDKITFVQGDIVDQSVVADALQDCEVVFHQAAVVSVTQTVNDPVASALVNDLGTLKVLEAARQAGVRRVVLASSSAVYGDDPQSPKTESMTPSPLSPYALQKLTNERYAALYGRLYGLKTVCLRYFNVFGPRQDPSSPYSGVISIFMSRAVDGLAPTLFGDGRQTRDFVFVHDVVQANLLAASRPEAVGQVFNIGTQQAIEIGVLWQKIAGLAGCSTQASHAPPRVGDILHSLANIQKARDILNFSPGTTLDEGLSQTLAWYRQNL